ncbi:MAG TPA: hypothetical protein VMT88_07050 [Actinomycetes bacterium]|nr:hypothetical protein [Actinomycetes bacterium]
MSPRSKGLLIVGGAAALAAGLVPMSGAMAADPVGNNGTVKIDGVAFDTAPDNQPHVGCNFQVDWYGFDAGAINSHVTFEAQPPTGRGILLQDDVNVGEDAAGGGTDLDFEKVYNLTGPLLGGGYKPHPIQGYHVMLTINTDGAQGADVKHKVFWVQACDSGSGGSN